MRIPVSLAFLLTFSATSVSLIGCSVGGGQTNESLGANSHSVGESLDRSVGNVRGPVMAARPGYSTPSSQLWFGDTKLADAKKPKSGVYVAQFNASSTNLYALPDARNAPPRCTIATGYVNGIGVNSQGVLYVPQEGSPSTVTTYAKGSCTASKLTLSDPDGDAGDVAFSSTGVTYVSNLTGVRSPIGNVVVYPKGKTSPTATLTDASIEETAGIATDSKNNVYLSYNSKLNATAIIEFPSGKMPGKVLPIKGASFIVGVTFDDKDNLIAVDDAASAILVYAPPYTGQPTTTFPTKSNSADAKLDVAQKNLYVGDVTNGTLDVYAYPSGKYEYSVSNGLDPANTVEGVAVDPSN